MHVRRGGAQCHADAEFAHPVGHQVGDHSIDPDGRQHQRQHSKDRQQGGRELLRPQRIADGGVHGFGLQQEVAVHGLHFAPHRGQHRRGIAGGANGQHRGREVILQHRKVDERSGFLPDGLVIGRAGDADHFRRGGLPEEFDALADGIFAGPIGVGGSPVDDGHARAGLAIRGGEIAAALERNAHRPQESGPHELAQNDPSGALAVLRRHGARERNMKRPVVGQRGRGHPGDGAGPLQRTPLEVAALIRIESVVGDVENHDAEMRRIEARVESHSVAQAAHEQAGAHQRDHRKGHLRHDQQGTRIPTAPELRRLAGTLFEAAGQVDARRADGRRQSENQAGQYRERQSVDQHRVVQPHPDGGMTELRRPQGPQHVARPQGEQQAGRTAQKRQHDALRQQLADQPPAACA